jgi:hypothetical protein
MAAWTAGELDQIGSAAKVDVASRRADGSYSPYVTIWGVRSGDDIYVRSAHGPENGWFRRAKARGTGRIRAGDVERDVQFTETAADVDPAVDQAYHVKYDSYGQQYVGPVTGPAIPTLRVTPMLRADLN